MKVEFLIQWDGQEYWEQDILDNLDLVVEISGNQYVWGDPITDYRGVNWVSFVFINPSEATMSMLYDIHNDWFYLTKIIKE